MIPEKGRAQEGENYHVDGGVADLDVPHYRICIRSALVEDKVAAVVSEWVYKAYQRHTRGMLPPSFPMLDLESGMGKSSRAVFVLRKFVPPAPKKDCGSSTYAAVAVTFPNTDARPLQRFLYLIFKGTTDIQEWLVNVSIQRNRDIYKSHGIGVHTAFQQEISNRFEQLKHEMLEWLRDAARQDVADGAQTALVITGHSLGGAYATVFFAVLKLILLRSLSFDEVDDIDARVLSMLEKAKCVTFAAPMVFGPLHGHAEVSAEFRSTMSSSRNYMFRNDPVPRAYAKLHLKDYLHAVLEQASGVVPAWLKLLPGVGSRVESGVASVQEWVDQGHLKDWETEAAAYHHFSEVQLLPIEAQLSRSWETFALSAQSVEDHAIAHYVEQVLQTRQVVARIVTENYGPIKMVAFASSLRAIQYWFLSQTAIASAILFVFNPSSCSWEELLQHGKWNGSALQRIKDHFDRIEHKSRQQEGEQFDESSRPLKDEGSTATPASESSSTHRRR